MSKGTSKGRRKAREERAARLQFDVPKASKGQRIEASTKLKCKNITNRSIFIEGLQDAGLQVVLRTDSGEKDLNRVLIAVQSQEVAHQIVKALNGYRLQRQKMDIKIKNRGTVIKNAKEPLPNKEFIHQCVNNAFTKKASKKGLAREGPENAVTPQKARANIMVPDVVIKKEEVDDDLIVEKGEAGAMGVLDTKSGNSDGLGEQVIKQEKVEERAKIRDDSIRPGTSTTQETKAGEAQSDLRRKRRQIKAARTATPTRSPTPEDILSALYASLV